MDEEIYHHGVKGMKWGVRRHQKWQDKQHAKINKRYDKEASKAYKKLTREEAKSIKTHTSKISSHAQKAKARDRENAARNAYRSRMRMNESLRKLEHERVNSITQSQYRKAQVRNAAIVTSGVLGGALGATAMSVATKKYSINPKATTDDRIEAINRYYN